MKPFNCLHANCMQLLRHTFVILCILKLSVHGGHCLHVKQHGQEKEESKKKYTKPTSEDPTGAFLNAGKRVCTSLGKCETLVVAGKCLSCYLRRGLDLR